MKIKIRIKIELQIPPNSKGIDFKYDVLSFHRPPIVKLANAAVGTLLLFYTDFVYCIIRIITIVVVMQDDPVSTINRRASVDNGSVKSSGPSEQLLDMLENLGNVTNAHHHIIGKLDGLDVSHVSLIII